MVRRLMIAVSAAVLCCLLGACIPSTQFTIPDSAEEQAVTDLSGYSVETDGPFRLFGNTWELYWKELHEPASISAGGPPVLVRGGEAWNGVHANGETLEADGWGTYRTVLILPESGRLYSFYMTNQDSAYRFWIDGVEYCGNGRVADTIDGYIPQRLPQVCHHYAEGNELELVMQIAKLFGPQVGRAYKQYLFRDPAADYLLHQQA